MSVPAGVAADAPVVLPAGVLSITENTVLRKYRMRVRVEVTTLGRTFEHVIDIKFSYHDFPSVHIIEGPFHPHISGDQYCCDYGVRSQILELVQSDKYLEAGLVLMSGLSFINPRSAYSMYDARRCSICEQYSIDYITCRSCERVYCPRHASPCSWCGASSSTCRRCSTSTCSECHKYRLIIELAIPKNIKRVLIANGITDINEFIKGDRLISLEGIGPKTEIKILNSLMPNSLYQINIYWYLWQYLELNTRNYLSEIPRNRTQRLASREIIAQLHLNRLSQNVM